MRQLRLLITLALCPVMVHAQDQATDRVSAATATLNVVLPVAAEAELARSAAPPHLRAEATVYVYGRRGFVRHQVGTNGFTCLVNRDAFLYGAAAFKPTCWDAVGAATYVPVMLRVGELLAAGATAQAVTEAIDAGFASGQFTAPDRGGVAYMLAGDVAVDPATGRVTQPLFPGHFMFYAVGATSAQLGHTPDAAQADPTLPFVFAGGAGGAHGLAYIITVPGTTHLNH